MIQFLVKDELQYLGVQFDRTNYWQFYSVTDDHFSHWSESCLIKGNYYLTQQQSAAWRAVTRVPYAQRYGVLNVIIFRCIWRRIMSMMAAEYHDPIFREEKRA